MTSPRKPASPNPVAANPDGLTGGRCPICRQPGRQAWKPFCSKTCADKDLGAWFNEDYAIAGEPADQADETPTREQGEG